MRTPMKHRADRGDRAMRRANPTRRGVEDRLVHRRSRCGERRDGPLPRPRETMSARLVVACAPIVSWHDREDSRRSECARVGSAKHPRIAPTTAQCDVERAVGLRSLARQTGCRFQSELGTVATRGERSLNRFSMRRFGRRFGATLLGRSLCRRLDSTAITAILAS